jgi:hypothetical protein
VEEEAEEEVEVEDVDEFSSVLLVFLFRSFSIIFSVCLAMQKPKQPTPFKYTNKRRRIKITHK